ncbi:MAG: glucosamine-6-phosphate deaminase [Spirochaetota bacterium]
MHSIVEQKVLERSGMQLIYPPLEKIGVIIVNSFPELGTLTALRFIEWVQGNPGGVICLPTGKTPEYFIKEVVRFLNTWDKKDTGAELESWGLNPAVKPDMGSLHFVQIDEFYPINPKQHNSFYYYVNRFYIKGFRLDPTKALLIDCTKVGLQQKKSFIGLSLEDIWKDGEVDLSLRYRQPSNSHEAIQKELIESIDQWCAEYEAKIRELGGIGFFLGGIGPDGHIGFNIRGSDLYSTTRLTPTNYETQAAAAQDLGGIEIAKKRLVITIGLSTIVYNPSCVAIVMAAGEAKAKVVADAVEKPQHIHYPATILHNLPNARFYITRGAAKELLERKKLILINASSVSKEEVERIIVDISLKKNKQIEKLREIDIVDDPLGSLLLKKTKSGVEELKHQVIQSLKEKIERGCIIKRNCTFLHTEPHHDDIMLGYLPGVVRHIREHSTNHHFVTLTGGFTSVTNMFMLRLLTELKEYLVAGFFNNLFEEGYFNPDNIVGRNRDVWQYLDGVAAGSEVMKREGRLRRLLRDCIFVYDETDPEQLKDRVDELINYFSTQYPGRKDLPHIQRLKGMCREWEGDCLWGYFGWHSGSIHHLRLAFYTGDIFLDEPTIERDVMPIVRVLREVKPDVVTLALDPEASGPDAHYKALQALTEALSIYERESEKDIEIWGYRNVWYRFHPSEANMFIPVSLNMFALQENAFKNSFVSQMEASFPSYDYDGPFYELAQMIQVTQYQMLKTCLGREFFNEHESALLRATRGIVFIKKMNLQMLYKHSRELRKITENR